MRPLYYLVSFDVAVISILGAAVARHVVNPYPTSSIVVGMLFAANFVFVWKNFNRPGAPSPESSGSPLLLRLAWLGAAGYTIVTIAMVVSWIRKLDFLSTSQVIFGILLSWLAWFSVRRLRQTRSDRSTSK